jgi:alpha-N-arabinofuranosidase
VDDAVAWLKYVNKPGKTKGEPPRVRYWEIGNENYYFSDVPYVKQAAHNGKQYARRVAKFARALKEADPRIKIIAIAEENFESDFEPVHEDWVERLLNKAAGQIDYIAIHNGYVPGLWRDYDLDVRTVYRAMLAAPGQVRKSLDRISAKIEKHAPKHADRIQLAVTEWSPSFQIALDGPYLDHPKTLGSALFTASNLKNYIEAPDVGMANYFKLNDQLWAGMIGARDGKFIANAPYYAFLMYRRHFGVQLVKTVTESPTYDTRGAGYVTAHRNVPYLDVVSSLSKNGKKLYIMVINKHFDQDISARIDIEGFKARKSGRAFIVTGTGIDANTGTELFQAPGMKWPKQATDKKNPRFAKGGKKEIRLEEKALDTAQGGFKFSFGKHSITAIELELAE